MKFSLRFRHAVLFVCCAIMLCHPAVGQQTAPGSGPTDARKAGVAGTVADSSGAPLPGATVVLVGSTATARRTAVANDTGYFEFRDLVPGIPYHVVVSADKFASWTTDVTLKPGQFLFLSEIGLQVEGVNTTVNVTRTSEEVGLQQVKVEEQQHCLASCLTSTLSMVPTRYRLRRS